MKRLLLILTLVSAFMFSAGATGRYSQYLTPHMKYKDLKQIYDPSQYIKPEGARFNPGWTGFASFVLPGLGQVICGEPGRALAFFGPVVALGVADGLISTTVLTIGLTEDVASSMDQSHQSTTSRKLYIVNGVFGAAMLGVAIWSVIDAVKVTKVKNMYEYDLKHSGFSMNVYPSFQTCNAADGSFTTAGLTLALRF